MSSNGKASLQQARNIYERHGLSTDNGVSLDVANVIRSLEQDRNATAMDESRIKPVCTNCTRIATELDKVKQWYERARESADANHELTTTALDQRDAALAECKGHRAARDRLQLERDEMLLILKKARALLMSEALGQLDEAVPLVIAV